MSEIFPYFIPFLPPFPFTPRALISIMAKTELDSMIQKLVDTKVQS